MDKSSCEAREARRRRILENSNKRLEKITGRPFEEPEEPIDRLLETDRIIYPDPDTDPIPDELPPMIFNEAFRASATGAQQQFPMMGDENMAHIMQSLLSNLGGAAGGGGGFGQQAQPPVETPDNFVVKIIRTRVPIVVLSLAVFLSFYTNRSHLFSGNVLLSLLLWEAVELFLLKYFNKLNQKRSSITFVLALFAIPPHLVDRCLTMLGMLHKIIQDVSVFMFVFVFLHYFALDPQG